MSISPKAICRSNAISIKIPRVLFVEIKKKKKKIPKISIETHQKIPKCKKRKKSEK